MNTPLVPESEELAGSVLLRICPGSALLSMAILQAIDQMNAPAHSWMRGTCIWPEVLASTSHISTIAA